MKKLACVLLVLSAVLPVYRVSETQDDSVSKNENNVTEKTPLNKGESHADKVNKDTFKNSFSEKPEKRFNVERDGSVNKQNNDEEVLEQSPSDENFNHVFDESQTGPKGFSSVYPSRPEILYKKSLKSAEQGDARSQYSVSKALKECIGVPDFDGIKELEYRGDVIIDSQLSAKLYRDAEFCKKMHAMMSTEAMQEASEKWYKQSLINKDKMALAQHWFRNMKNFSKQQAENILLDALYYGDNEIYILIAMYYARYDVENSIRQKAWDLVYCVKADHCNEKNAKLMYKSELFAYEFEEIVALTDVLLEKIERRELVALD
ncbi:MAG: hypothetical protein AAGB12_09185 [Pseudomonadota bacterium]